MAFSIPSITTNYSSTPIKIADGNGTHTMTFSGIQEPSTLPEVTYARRNVKVTRTRPGATHPGYRIFGSFGAGGNDRDLKLTLHLVLAAQVTQLQGYYDARPGTFLITPDGTTKYYAMFKEGGLVVENYQWNQRVFSKVTLELYLITTTTQGFVS